jgi:hypothetical protein
MSIEQNEPQSIQSTPGQQGLSATQDNQNGQAQQRRRRRRRKTGKPPLAATSTENSQAATGEQMSLLANPPQNGSEGESAVRDSSREAVREQGRDQSRNQPREAREARREGNPSQDRGDSGPRQARPQGQQSHGKKQQRQGKGGGSSQGRHFSKGGSGGGQPQTNNREHNPGNGIGGSQASQGGQGGGQGGRRKNKVRRPPPSFVGPMDHSYRMVNGNIADGPPSTIDFRSNGTANGNGNGNVHGRNGYSDVPEVYVPIMLRDDAPVRIVCFIEDLFVVAKMQETARKLGVKVSFAKAEKDIVARLTDAPEGERPSLIVFDLNNVNAKPLTLIPKLKSKLKRGTSVIGFLSHVQGDLKVKAIEAGCDMVMPKSAFSQNLPNLLRRHGLDEELETVEV